MHRQDLRREIEAELASAREQAEEVRATPPLVPWRALFGLAALNVLVLLASPNYGTAWITGSLLVALLLGMVCLLPTTRPARSGCLIPLGDLSALLGPKGRGAVVPMINALLLGGVPMAPGMTVVLGINVLFALWMLDGAGPQSALVALWVIAQSALVIGFYVWLLYYRPYSPRFLASLYETFQTIRGEGGDTTARARSVASLSLFLVISAAVLLGVFIFPGFTLRLLAVPGGPATVPFALTVLVIVPTQMFAVRAWQGVESGRWATRFLEHKQAQLEVLLERVERDSPEELDEVQQWLEAARILRVYRHDLFGRLPVYLPFPDLGLLRSCRQGPESVLVSSDGSRSGPG